MSRADEQTGGPAFDVRLHADILDWLPDAPPSLRRRLNLVMRHLVAFGRTGVVKAVVGAGKGWRRTPLGGNQGMQFYAWWAPAGAAPVAACALPFRTILVRAVRHHDEMGLLDAGSAPDDYYPLSAAELASDRSSFGFAFTDSQERVARSRSPVRFLKGHPGSGKSTALWLAAASARGRHGVYLTFSDRLRSEASRYLAALGDREFPVDVMRVGDLVAEVRGVGNTAEALREIPPAAADELVRLAGPRSSRGPWAERPDELYAELYAYSVGHALPVSFRGLPPCDGAVLPRGTYRRLRGSAIGHDAADEAAAVAAIVAEAGALDTLFPGPCNARKALDGLMATGTIPPRLADVDWVFLDEAQDLSVVEAVLLAELCGAIGRARQGAPPIFIAAGDEGQTVLPTDFEWGKLADIVAERLGKRSEFELTHNVRSPYNLALVVNHSWDLYRLLSKEDRPRGYADAEVDDACAGRVLYVPCRTPGDFEAVLELFNELPNAALVHPAQRIDPELSAQAHGAGGILTAVEAKGLDFQTVGVLDAARTLECLDEYTEKAAWGTANRLAALWARQQADRLRVALSRATENLLFIETRCDAADRARIARLCAEAEWSEVDPADLRTVLGADDREPAELAAAFCDEVVKLLGVQPGRAYRRACQAVALLGHPRSTAAAVDAVTRREAWELKARAALELADRPPDVREPYSTSELLDQAAAAYRRAGRTADAALVTQARDLAGEPPDDADVVETIGTILDLLPDGGHEVQEALRTHLRAWVTAIAGAPRPTSAGSLLAQVEMHGRCCRVLGAREPRFADQLRTFALRAAGELCAMGHHGFALKALEELEPPDPLAAGRCFEHMGAHREAAESLMRAGDLDGALRNARRVPDLPTALQLARNLGHPDLPALEWLDRLLTDFDQGPGGPLSRLTPEERQWLGSRVATAMSRAATGKEARKADQP